MKKEASEFRAIRDGREESEDRGCWYVSRDKLRVSKLGSAKAKLRAGKLGQVRVMLRKRPNGLEEKRFVDFQKLLSPHPVSHLMRHGRKMEMKDQQRPALSEGMKRGRDGNQSQGRACVLRMDGGRSDAMHCEYGVRVNSAGTTQGRACCSGKRLSTVHPRKAARMLSGMDGDMLWRDRPST